MKNYIVGKHYKFDTSLNTSVIKFKILEKLEPIELDVDRYAIRVLNKTVHFERGDTIMTDRMGLYAFSNPDPESDFLDQFNIDLKELINGK